MRSQVIIDQDTLGPAGTNLQAVAILLNAPDVDVPELRRRLADLEAEEQPA